MQDNKSQGEGLLGETLGYLFGQRDVSEQFLLPDRLRLDYFVHSRNIAFEYDGIQHSRYSAHFHRSPEGFRDHQYRDKKKEEYCLTFGISLIRISHEEVPDEETVTHLLSICSDGPGSDILSAMKVLGGYTSKYEVTNHLSIAQSKEDRKLQAKKQRREQYLRMKQFKKEYDQ